MQRAEAERLKTAILGGMNRFKDVPAPPAHSRTGTTPRGCEQQFQLLQQVWKHLRFQKSGKSFTVKGFKEVNQVNAFLRGIVSYWSCSARLWWPPALSSELTELEEDWEPGNNLAEPLQRHRKVLPLGRTHRKISFFLTRSYCTQSQAGGTGLGSG